MKNPNIAIIKIGYHSYAIEDTQTALELMAIMSKAVQVEHEAYDLRNETNQTHFLADEQLMPELKFVATNKVNGHETVKEAKERFAREKKDREDMEGGILVPTLAELPAPTDDPF